VGKGTMIGIPMVFVAVFGCMIMEGGNPAALIAPPALLLIIVGSLGAAFAGTSLEGGLDALKAMAKTFGDPGHDSVALVQKIGQYADITRREGVLALEARIKEEDNDVLRRGLALIVDGIPVNEARAVMAVEAKSAKNIWKKRAAFYDKLGGYAPTLGVLGTVLGLINVLAQLGGDTASLGHLIAAAFIATFFGVFFANAIFLPIGAKMTALGEAEFEYRVLVIEGVSGIGDGKSPRALVELLTAYMPEEERAALEAAREQKAA
jgi:chemotaxis protein MotA